MLSRVMYRPLSVVPLFCVLLGAGLALGAVWIVPPGFTPAMVACVDACANQCGLAMGSPRPLTLAEIVRMRRLLLDDAGSPTP